MSRWRWLGGIDMDEETQSTGDPLPPNCELIEVRVGELQQLFNAMDASPFRERDLDPDAEEFIASWAREAPRGASLALLVDVNRAPGLSDEPAALRDTVHEFFTHRAQVSRTRLRELLRIGRTSLVVGTVFLAAALGLGDLVASAMKGQRLGELLREGLVICGWVAMWRPLEIFLYGWWPIRRQALLYDRLGAMPVRIAYNKEADLGSWRRDWPAVPPVRTTPQKSRQRPPGAIAVPERGPVATAAMDAFVPERESKTGKTTT